MNSSNKFEQSIGSLLSNVAEILSHDGLGRALQQPLQTALEELHLALTETEVVEAELRQQNDELLRTRAAVEAERQKYQDLFEFAPDGYIVTDLAGIILEANYAAANLLNVSSQFLVNKLLIRYVELPERQQFYALLHQCQTAIQEEWQVHLLPRDRPALNAALTVAPIYHNRGKQVGWRWLLRDLTIHQQNQAKLQQALEFEAMLKRITDKVRDSLDESQIWQTAVEELTVVLGVSGCNAACYNLADGTSTICYDYVTNIPASQGRVAQMANFPEIYRQLLQGQHFQFCSIVPNPVRGRVAMLACPIMNNAGVLGDLWLIHHQDYAFNDIEIRLVQQVANQCAIAIRQARLYQAAMAQVAALEHLNRMKDEFLSTVSHELRTPVTNMKIAIRMLQLTPTAAAKERYLKILQSECDREVELINNLLDLQQLEAMSYSCKFEVLNLHEWLPNLLEPFELRFQERQQLLRVDLPSSIPPIISDRSTLGRVLAELLNNAHKYTASGGEIMLSFDCNSAATDSAIVTTISVKNQAEIPAAELPQLFEKFYRVPQTDPWQQKGTGLGLALVQKLVAQLQGTIRVESEQGWTTFTIELPNQSLAGI